MAKEYFIIKANEKGCVVYDFQSEDMINDLSNYKDYTHYSLEVSDWMTDCVARKENVVTVETYKEYIEQLKKVEIFRNQVYEVKVENN